MNICDETFVSAFIPAKYIRALKKVKPTEAVNLIKIWASFLYRTILIAFYYRLDEKLYTYNMFYV